MIPFALEFSVFCDGNCFSYGITLFHMEKTSYLVHFKSQLLMGNLHCIENKAIKEMDLCAFAYTHNIDF